MKRRSVSILVYDGVEVLDFAGPFEVFAVTDELTDGKHFEVSLAAVKDQEYTAVNGMRVLPNRVTDDIPAPDVVVIPGGRGSKQVMHDKAVLDWIRRASNTSEILMSVCTGARVLAALGMLDGLEVTTHHQAITHLRALAPTAQVISDHRFVDTGGIITTGGISAGIDGSLHIVARLLGEVTARRTAKYMEYDWKPDRDYGR